MFQVGDLVKLKSGSPLMTVSFVDEKWVRVRWFQDGQFRKEEFIFAILEKQA